MNTYHFKGNEGKGIMVKKNISYHELLRVVYHILQLDSMESSISMKYAFNGKIPTSPIQLRDDGDVKIFICLNCTYNKLSSPLCITADTRSEHNVELVFVHGSGHLNDRSMESLNVVAGESIIEFNYELVERYNVVKLNMNGYGTDDYYHVLDTNQSNNVQGIENKDSSNKAAQTMKIHSIMNIEDGLMNGIPTMIEEVNNDDQNMNLAGGSGYGANDDHIEVKQIYSSKKEL